MNVEGCRAGIDCSLTLNVAAAGLCPAREGRPTAECYSTVATKMIFIMDNCRRTTVRVGDANRDTEVVNRNRLVDVREVLLRVVTRLREIRARLYYNVRVMFERAGRRVNDLTRLSVITATRFRCLRVSAIAIRRRVLIIILKDVDGGRTIILLLLLPAALRFLF